MSEPQRPQKVELLREYTDIPATLRRIADDVERGECGELLTVGLVMATADAIEVYGLGPVASDDRVAIVLWGGFMKATRLVAIPSE